ncbi:MAG: glycosyltransferase family 4 protein [Acidimicrobiales bacterium]
MPWSAGQVIEPARGRVARADGGRRGDHHRRRVREGPEATDTRAAVSGATVVVPDPAALAATDDLPVLASGLDFTALRLAAVPAPPLPLGLRLDGPEALADVARAAGIERITVVAWRDLDDPEAGGSELHAHHIATSWAEAGIDVTVRTSAVPGASEVVWRDGYRAVRRAGRYAVFAGTMWEGVRRRPGPGEGLVEVWNGMPFFSPLWHRGPRIVFLHHVHAEMWRMVLPAWLARVGEEVERWVAPPFYRASRVVTLSGSSRQEICGMLGLRPDRVSVAAPGIEPRFSPGPGRSPVPFVVAVGRLVPVKRFDLLLAALAEVRSHRPDLRAAIIGEGYERSHLEALRHELGAEDWLSLPGRVDEDELVEWYRRAWVVASTSLREGWGMTLTEAAACGTPAVATDIAGHRDAVVDGQTGLLAHGAHGMASALIRVIDDEGLRGRLGRQAIERARWFTWGATARSTLEALASEAASRPSRSPHRSPRG